MVIQESLVAPRGGSITISWSQPTPRWRSAMARTASAVRTRPELRTSRTTKSFPKPCILTKSWAGLVIMLGLYGRKPPGVQRHPPVPGDAPGLKQRVLVRRLGAHAAWLSPGLGLGVQRQASGSAGHLQFHRQRLVGKG